MLIEDLKELGLTEEEAKVYLATLELGGSYVSTIARKAGVNRVGCYHTLANLIKKGIVSSYSKNKIKYFTVESPKILVNKHERLLKQAKSILPELESLSTNSVYKPKIQYYEGLEGIKRIFQDTLSTQNEILGYTNLKNLPRVIPEEYIKSYTKAKIDKGIKSRMLSPVSEEARKYTKKYYPKNFDHNLVEIFLVNPGEFWFEYEINIYDDKVALFSLKKDELIGLVLQSPVYAKTQRGIFNLAWLGATSFVAK